jgi:uncharacterized protein YbjT (DUF2867 family)
LIIGCGCRGLALAARLRRSGHVVRGTTRDSGRTAELHAAGIEPWVGDPDRIGTVFAAFDQITVACVLLGSATGDAERIAALHTTRLEMLLSKLLDTTARGIVYEARGSVATEVLEHGAELVRSACEQSRIPHALIDTDPGDPDRWADAAVEAVGAVLASPPSG